MKNKTITATLALSLLFGSIPAFADGSSTTTPTTTRVTGTVSQTTQEKTVDPDSFLYSLKEIFNQLKLALTFNDKEKADMLIKQANDKISELEVLKANGNEKYDDEYSKKINEILKKTDDVLKVASAQSEDKDDETKEKEQQELQKKQQAFTEVQKHSLVVLHSHLDGKHGKGITNAIAKQEEKLKVETTSPAIPTNVVQTTEEQTTTSVQQTTTVPSTQQSTVTTESNTSTAVQAEPEDRDNDKQQVKAKHDNGLHLGQIKHDGEKEKHEHNNK